MLIAIDSSTAWAGLCVYDIASRAIIDERIWQTGTHQCEQLLPAMDAMLRLHGRRSRDLTAVAVAVGPGTFNGVRVAVSTAKLLARALDVPILGIGTLELYAAAVPCRGLLVRPMLSAARGEIATALWRAGDPPEEIERPRIATPDELFVATAEPVLFTGELTEEWRAALARLDGNALVASPSQAARRPATLAELAVARLARGEADDAATLAAVYLRQPHITVPRG